MVVGSTPEPRWRAASLCAIEAREEHDAVVEVVVLPAPLEARDLDGELGVAGVLELHQRLRGRHGHRDEDDHRDTVQTISTLVLCTRVVSATAPCDFRNLTSD